MDWLTAILLALLQGITEFLPVSSSAHLLLPSQLFGIKDQGLGFDLAVHSGSLIAVVFHYRYRLQKLVLALASIRNPVQGTEASLARNLVIASLPLFVAGPLLVSLAAGMFRNGLIIACTTLIFGLLLWFADQRAGCDGEYELNLRGALWIGLAQVLAVVPGVSRSGITITAGRLIGLSREGAASFSFLLAIPAIGGIALVLLSQIVRTGTLLGGVSDPVLALVGFVVSAVVSLLVIRLFLRFVERIGLVPFAIYRIVLGTLLLALFVGG